MDGYNILDGYGDKVFSHQINIKLTASDYALLQKINKEYFEDECSNSTIGRILLKKGFSFFKV